MQFEKGRNKTGGRKPGSTNKASTDIKTKIAALIDQQFESIVEDLQSLDPKERVTAYIKFLEFVVPKIREQKIDMSTLSDSEIDELLDKALDKLN